MSFSDLPKKFSVLDIGLIKLATAAFILMIAKLWDTILYLEWYYYLGIAVIFSIKPIISMFSKAEGAAVPVQAAPAQPAATPKI